MNRTKQIGIKWMLCCLLLLGATYLTFAQNKTENLVIVTLDGMRWQEVFGGVDSTILLNKNYTRDSAGKSKKFWSGDTAERRKKLFPFLWNTIAKSGQLYVNRWFNNKVDNANRYFFSYPGYNEIFTGILIHW